MLPRREIFNVRRKALLPLQFAIVPVCTLVILTFWRRFLLVACACFLLASTCVYITAVGMFKMEPTDTLLAVLSVLFSAGLACAEVDSSVMSASPAWPLFVVVTDLLLVCQAPVKLIISVVVACVLLLAVTWSEGVFRYGLFDFDMGDYNQQSRWQRFDCVELPCPKGLFSSLVTVAAYLCIFILDFVLTRNFAKSATDEKNRILASIATANHIATSLSRFDLEAASLLLDDPNVPEDLKLAFGQILNNLRSYRPYLPQSVLCFEMCEVVTEGDTDSDDSKDSEGKPKRALSHENSVSLLSPSSRVRSPNASTMRMRSFEKISASLLVQNISNSLDLLNHSNELFKQLTSELVAVSSNIIASNRGTLDHFLGDLILSNFGGSRPHRGHSCSCVKAANGISVASEGILAPFLQYSSDLRVNIGMGSGEVTSGDLGSEDIMRFCVIGKLPRLVSAVEQVGRQAGVKMLCEGGLHREARNVFETRVHLQLMLHDGVEHILYEVLQKEERKEQTEWLYELGDVDKWDGFNRTAKALLMGEPLPILPSKYDGSEDPNVCLLKMFIENGPPDTVKL